MSAAAVTDRLPALRTGWQLPLSQRLAMVAGGTRALPAALALLWLSGAASDEPPSRAFMPQHGIPTPKELHEACPEQYKACTHHEPCAQALDAADSHIPGTPPEFFKELIGCFQASPVGQTRRLAQQRHRDTLRRVVSDVQCDACTLVVEDLWSMLLHRPAPEAGQKQKSLDATLSTMLKNMCGDPANNEDPGEGIARWVGMYNIHNCSEALALDHATDAGVACAGTEKGKEKTEGYLIAREAGPEMPCASQP